MKETVQHLKDTHKFSIGDEFTVSITQGGPLKRKIIGSHGRMMLIEGEVRKRGTLMTTTWEEHTNVLINFCNKEVYVDYKRITSKRLYPKFPLLFNVGDSWKSAKTLLTVTGSFTEDGILKYRLRIDDSPMPGISVSYKRITELFNNKSYTNFKPKEEQQLPIVFNIGDTFNDGIHIYMIGNVCCLSNGVKKYEYKINGGATIKYIYHDDIIRKFENGIYTNYQLFKCNINPTLKKNAFTAEQIHLNYIKKDINNKEEVLLIGG